MQENTSGNSVCLVYVSREPATSATDEIFKKRSPNEFNDKSIDIAADRLSETSKGYWSTGATV